MADITTFPIETIDIETPAADAADLTAALVDSVVGEVIVDITGSWLDDLDPLFITTTPRKVRLLGSVLSIPGIWLDNLSIGNITQPDIIELSFTNLGGLVVDINLPQMPAMTAFRFPILKYVEHVFIRDNYGVLQVVDFPELKVIDDSFIYDGQDIDTLPEWVLPSLVWINNSFTIQNSAISTLGIDVLRMVGNTFTLSGLPNLVVADASSLEYGNIQISSVPSLTVLDLSGLKVTNQINVSAIALVTVSFGALRQNGTNTSFSGCALNQASVDGILVALAALDGTNGTTSYNNFTVDLSGGTNASPSATGLAAKAVLELRGNTVTVN